MPILWKHRVCLFSLLRFFDKLFDIINDDPFLMFLKDSAIIFVNQDFPPFFSRSALIWKKRGEKCPTGQRFIFSEVLLIKYIFQLLIQKRINNSTSSHTWQHQSSTMVPMVLLKPNLCFFVRFVLDTTKKQKKFKKTFFCYNCLDFAERQIFLSVHGIFPRFHSGGKRVS